MPLGKVRVLGPLQNKRHENIRNGYFISLDNLPTPDSILSALGYISSIVLNSIVQAMHMLKTGGSMTSTSSNSEGGTWKGSDDSVHFAVTCQVDMSPVRKAYFSHS